MGCCCSDKRGEKVEGVGNGFKKVVLLPINDFPTGLYSQLEISLSVSNILNDDAVSKSNYLAIIHTKEWNGSHKELSRAVITTQTSYPVCKIDYCFAVVQTLIIKIYCLDEKCLSLPCELFQLKKGAYVGGACFTLSEIVTTKNQGKTAYLQKEGDTGTSQSPLITINAKEIVASRTEVELELRCSKLVMTGTGCLRVCILEEKGGHIPIFQTETLVNNSNPVWRQIFLPMHQFVSKDKLIVIECYNANTDGTHTFKAKLQTSLHALENLEKEKIGVNFYFPFGDFQDNKMLESQLFVDKFREVPRYSFLNYVSNGVQLKFMVAVDFSASSGDPKEPSSLHYIPPPPSGDYLNAYQVIKEVGAVIEDYEYDTRFPLWGFGKKQSDELANQIFNLNGENECEVTGTEGMLSVYARALERVAVAGPNVLGEVIQKVDGIVRNCRGSIQDRYYYVLLIITNGVMNDHKETIDSIVAASGLPLSILIAGVGAADYAEMQIFSADSQARLKSSTGRIASRNNVQFVSIPYLPGAGDVSISQLLLGKVPQQLLEYMRSIKPHFLHDA